VVEFALIPDPARYEWREVDGKRCLFDKLDRILIPEDVLAEGAKQMSGLPIYALDPLINDRESYISERVPVIARALATEEDLASFADASEAFLSSLARGGHDFAILSIDIVGSTVLSSTLEPTLFARIMTVAATELSAIVPLYHGHVLKYTGDGLIAYFPAPSFVLKNDLSFHAALTMRALMYSGLNRVLAERGLPTLGARIGIDSGSAAVVTIGSPTTKQHSDIIGSVVSLACKIQARAPNGGIALGNETLRNLHVSLRNHCQPLDPGPDWQYAIEGKPYTIYQVVFENDDATAAQAGDTIAP